MDFDSNIFPIVLLSLLMGAFFMFTKRTPWIFFLSIPSLLIAAILHFGFDEESFSSLFCAFGFPMLLLMVGAFTNLNQYGWIYGTDDD